MEFGCSFTVLVLVARADVVVVDEILFVGRHVERRKEILENEEERKILRKREERRWRSEMYIANV